MKYVGVSTPAWTIVGDEDRGKYKDIPESDEPAPGQRHNFDKAHYIYQTAPKWKFGKDEGRGDKLFPASKVPGPGAYLEEEEEEKKDGGKKRKRNKQGNSISRRNIKVGLGPGTYDPKKLARSAPKFSFGYKSQTEREKEDVGPGKYNPKYNLKEINKFSTFSRSRRKGTDEMRVTCAPGPGSYFQSKSSKNFRVKKKGKKNKRKLSRGEFCTFGSKSHSRFKGIKSETPGVGRYKYQGHTIGHWIHSRGSRSRKVLKQRESNLKDRYDNEVPGPGAYSIKTGMTKSTAPSFGFGTMKRPKLRNPADPKIPGPAAYIGNVLDHEEVEDLKRDDSNFFGTSKRDFMKPDKKTDGEDGTSKKATTAYGKMGQADGLDGRKWMKNPLFQGPKFTFKGRRKNNVKKDMLRFPGPGAYYTSHNYMVGLTNPHHIIGTGDRFKQLRRKDLTPGPGDYNVSMGLSHNGVKFPKSLRKDPANVDPEIEVGPDTYEIKSTVPQLQPWEDKAQKEAGFKITLD